MDIFTSEEIQNSSDAIDRSFAEMTKENRGKKSLEIVKVVRDLNDHVADKIWHDINAGKNMDLNKVASKMDGRFRFISQFDSFLRSSVSHFTPTEDGAERLLIKYYKYLLQLKQVMKDRYDVDILKNIRNFIDDTDTQTNEYYTKVTVAINKILDTELGSEPDNYYVDRIKPFYINNSIYYEITLEPATDKRNKFHRITAFTKYDIFDNYSVALKFVDRTINVFGVDYPIKIIIDWKTSIRPCELINFAELIRIEAKINRQNNDYKALMDFITKEQHSLVEIIDFEKEKFDKFSKSILNNTKTGTSTILEILNKCRNISKNNLKGKNIIRYLLFRLNNMILKEQRPTRYYPNTYDQFDFSSKCMPFDIHPYAHYPKGHITSLYDLYQCIDASEYRDELLKRFIENNTYANNTLFTPIEDLSYFGDKEEVLKLVEKYNLGLYGGFKPRGEIGEYKNHLFIKEYDEDVFDIITKLKELSQEGSYLNELFDDETIEFLMNLDEDKLDDPIKAEILSSIFTKSKVHCIYGAAGTGKTTLINYVSRVLIDCKKLYLAKTHPAVENLRRKVKYKNNSDDFITIDQFINNKYYSFNEYDLVVVDECSTVKNEDMVRILSLYSNSPIILMGDVYQIEAIGFGNWFSIAKEVLPRYCCHELTTPFRSTNDFLKKLWNDIRMMSENNQVLEKTVRARYSHIINDDIFNSKSKDEIILCLNYNGLYGLNNINKLLQISNPSPPVMIGVWQFKKGDPILFNDSNRFACLYNNLKGEIINIIDNKTSVYFEVKVDAVIKERECEFEDGLDYISVEDKKTHLGFIVNRRAPYSSDNEETSNYHIIPFQVAYAVSIHKSQGLEYDSVKIVIADETEEQISHNIFYTAVTRAKNHLTIYWSPEVCNRILARIKPSNINKDFLLLSNKHNI